MAFVFSWYSVLCLNMWIYSLVPWKLILLVKNASMDSVSYLAQQGVILDAGVSLLALFVDWCLLFPWPSACEGERRKGERRSLSWNHPQDGAHCYFLVPYSWLLWEGHGSLCSVSIGLLTGRITFSSLLSFQGRISPLDLCWCLLWSLPLHTLLPVWSLHIDALGMASFSIFLL